MGAETKANPNAGSGMETVLLPLGEGARYIDGTPFTGDTGGVVQAGGRYYSVARPDAVPDGRPAAQTADGWRFPKNRIGPISILVNRRSLPTTYGAEAEATNMGPDGTYAPLPKKDQHDICELYAFMLETGTPPTDNTEEFRAYYIEMLAKLAAGARGRGHLVAPLTVNGQHITPDSINSHPYVGHIVGAMTSRTGFDTLQVFRTSGAQLHTGISNTEAAIRAGMGMQLLNPLFMSPTLAGPFIPAELRSMFAQLTPEQRAHMQRTGMRQEDLAGEYLSWRYVLRRLGSPSAGTWLQPPAETIPAYLSQGHSQLAAGVIGNVDRNLGMHGDRLRLILDGSGASTFEACALDTALYNPDVIVPLQLLYSASFTALEAMAIRNRRRDPVAEWLGLPPDWQAQLNAGHAASLAVSRGGSGARLYQNRTPGQRLPGLLELAERAPYPPLSEEDKVALRKAYAGRAAAKAALRRWCTEMGTDTISMQAYYDLGVGSPAFYMQAMRTQLRERHPNAKPNDIVRLVELDAAKSFHQTIEHFGERRNLAQAA